MTVYLPVILGQDMLLIISLSFLHKIKNKLIFGSGAGHSWIEIETHTHTHGTSSRVRVHYGSKSSPIPTPTPVKLRVESGVHRVLDL